MAKLILSLDDVVLEEIPLTKERTTIGRKPHNDIHIDNLAVSGEHAVIVTIMTDCILEDLGSTNGTLVNGVLAKRHVLRNNDVIELGKYKLKFMGVATAAATGHAPTPADYEKTMVWRPGGVKPPAGQPGNHAPGTPAAGTTTAGTATAGRSAAPASPPHAPPHIPAPMPASLPTPARASAPAPAAASPTAHASAQAAAPSLASAHASVAAAPAAGTMGVVRILSGPRAGRDLKLHKPLTTLGKPGMQVAVVTRRPQGYFIAHVEGATPTHVNGRPVGATPQALKDGDTFEIADVRMEFLLRDEAQAQSSSPLWKIALAILAIVIVGFVIYRMRA